MNLLQLMIHYFQGLGGFLHTADFLTAAFETYMNCPLRLNFNRFFC